jgi:sugar-specific transcriptional regulator TrmB
MVNIYKDVLNLDLRESEIFKYLLKNKERSATQIAKDIKIPRTSVYHTICNLLEKEIIVESKTKSGKTIYNAININTLKTIARENTKKAAIYEKTVKKFVKEYEKEAKRFSDLSVVVASSGIKSAWSLIEDVLLAKKDSYWLTATNLPFRKIISETEYFRRITHRRKRMKRTKSYIIADRSAFSEKIERQGETDFREVKLLPAGELLKSSIIIFGDNIGFISYGNEIKTIKIENKFLSETMKLFFKMIWDVLQI